MFFRIQCTYNMIDSAGALIKQIASGCGISYRNYPICFLDRIVTANRLFISDRQSQMLDLCAYHFFAVQNEGVRR